jgi:hypothetical protein
VPSGLGDFYREHLLELVRWVDSWAPELCPADLRAYVRAFERLHLTAQRLWARLLLRKGPRFIVSDLAYEEVGDPAGPVLALVLGGFLSLEQEVPARLAMLPRATLLTLCDALSLPRPRDQRRPALEATLAAAAPALRARSLLPLTVRREQSRTHARLAFAFFGETEGDLSTLVLSTLQRRRFAQAPRGAPWPSRAAFEAALALHEAADGTWSPALRMPEAAGLRRRLFCALAWPGLRPRDEARRGRGLWRLARHARAAGEGAFALRVLGALPKAVEGLSSLRWLHETGAREQEAWRLAALDGTLGGEVARYDYGRGRCRPAPKLPTMRARLVLPPGRQSGRVEGAALRHLGAFRGWHWENRFPAWVLYLSAADLIFAPSPGAFTHPQQTAPHDLFTEAFYPARAEALEARCAALASGAFGLGAAQGLWHRFGGCANALVPRQLPSSALWLALGALAQAPERWAALVAWLLRAPLRCRRGFPDLTLLSKGGELSFVEVKGPGDQLRREQREWLTLLPRWGFPATCFALEAAPDVG